MLIGSHNSFTYLKPKKWWMRLCNIFAKCQSKSILKQYDIGARYFDLRIRFNRPYFDGLVVAHGLMEYDTDYNAIVDLLSYLNKRSNNNIYIRILYEMPSKNNSKDSQLKEDTFISLCYKFEQMFPHIIFCGGQRKYDWKPLAFLKPHPESIDLYSSRTWTILDDWCPWLYAKLMNNKNYKKYKDKEPKNGFMLMDFIDNIKV